MEENRGFRSLKQGTSLHLWCWMDHQLVCSPNNQELLSIHRDSTWPIGKWLVSVQLRACGFKPSRYFDKPVSESNEKVFERTAPGSQGHSSQEHSKMKILLLVEELILYGWETLVWGHFAILFQMDQREKPKSYILDWICHLKWDEFINVSGQTWKMKILIVKVVIVN